ncbi:MAG: hypothetical protein EP329_10080 [Deltaproteobacteria bacterium]|nr:MAG: hypothetical protein EP329_10080 [Deltaproteobacteria bacterium]
MKLEAVLSPEAFIQEGVALADGCVALACTVGDDDDRQRNDLALVGDGFAARFGISGEAFVSIDADHENAYALGERGVVVQFRWRGVDSLEGLKASRKLYRNPAAAERGPLRRLRVIDGTPVCVGAFGQVYALRRGALEAMPFVDVYPDAVTLKDIAGARLDDMVAVSQHGVAAHFDGHAWRDLAVPDNAKLSSIALLDDGRYAIAGAGGVVLLGAGARWERLDVGDPERDYYGVAAHGGLIYAAHLGGVDVYDGQRLEPLPIDGEGDLELAFLRPGESGVWSFCGTTIGHIHGRSWTTVLSGASAALP